MKVFTLCSIVIFFAVCTSKVRALIICPIYTMQKTLTGQTEFAPEGADKTNGTECEYCMGAEWISSAKTNWDTKDLQIKRKYDCAKGDLTNNCKDIAHDEKCGFNGYGTWICCCDAEYCDPFKDRIRTSRSGAVMTSAMVSLTMAGYVLTLFH